MTSSFPRRDTRQIFAPSTFLGLTSIALVLANAAIYGQTYLTAWSGQHLVARLRVRLFQRLLIFPYTSSTVRPGGFIARFSTDLQMMIDAVSVSVPQLVVALATFISSFVTMIYLDWLLTLSLVLVAPIVSFAVSNFQRLLSIEHASRATPHRRPSATLSVVLGGQRWSNSLGASSSRWRASSSATTISSART